MSSNSPTSAPVNIYQWQWLAHADWSIHADKRFFCVAHIDEEQGIVVEMPSSVASVGGPSRLLEHLIGAPARRGIFGMDVCVGLPRAYAQQAEIDAFVEWLSVDDEQYWETWFDVAESPDQISLDRPFYPARSGKVKMDDLVNALGLEDRDALRRQCDYDPKSGQRWGSPLFWTIGATQVGKATISAWRDVVLPAIQAMRAGDAALAIWPFDGPIQSLVDANVILAEAFPTAYHDRLDIQMGSKRNMVDRSNQTRALCEWASKRDVTLSPSLVEAMKKGVLGEDAFDAVIGCLGMLDALLLGDVHCPPDPAIHRVEGWIFGT